MTLQLYMFESCPYCQRVMKDIADSCRMDIEIHDIHKNAEDYKCLIKIGGKDQVPCLLINGQPLYESLDIIEWMSKHPQEE